MYSKFTYPPLLYKESLFILVVEAGILFLLTCMRLLAHVIQIYSFNKQELHSCTITLLCL
jgi:hypothetical protein